MYIASQKFKRLYSEYSITELEKMVLSRLPGFKYYQSPFKHQLITMLYALQFDILKQADGGLGIYFQMRCGKTKMALDLMRARGIKDKVIIVTLKNVIYDWILDIKKNAPGYTYKILGDEKADARNKILASNKYNIYILNYESLYKHNQNKRGRDSNGNLIKPTLKDMLLPTLSEKQWNLFIIDESRLIMNPDAIRSRCCNKVSENSSNRFLLAGMPIGKTEAEIFNQQYCIDFGRQYGDSKSKFMHKYYVKRFNWAGYPEFVVREKMIDDLRKRMYRQSIRYRQEECFKTASMEYVDRLVDMKGDQLRVYNELKAKKKSTIITRKNKMEIVAQMSKFRQITGGWLKDIEEYNFTSNAKLEELKYLLENELADEPVVIFAYHRHEQQNLVDALSKWKMPVLKMTSSEKTEQINKARDLFNKKDKPYKAICSLKKFARGVNLSAANYMVMYSMDFDFESIRQAEKRLTNPTKKKKVTIIRLICKNTVDEKSLLKSYAAGVKLTDNMENKTLEAYI
jgi:SNF2 family DNA or RNA helicase